MLLSVIVPVYKTEDYLSNSIDSILKAICNDSEIILVDDGSPDGCPSICDDYSRRFTNIKVIHKSNGGVSDARNAGIRAATGTFLAFVDSDDQIDRDFFDVMLPYLLDSNTDIVCCGMRILGTQVSYLSPSTKTEYYYGKDCLQLLAQRNGCGDYLMNKIYRRSLFYGVEFPKGKIFEDVFTQHILFGKAQKVVWLDKCLYNYRINAAGISHGKQINLHHMDFVSSSYEQYLYIKKVAPQFSEVSFAKYVNSIVIVAAGFVSRQRGKLCRGLIADLQGKAQACLDEAKSNPYCSEKLRHELEIVCHGYYTLLFRYYKERFLESLSVHPRTYQIVIKFIKESNYNCENGEY